MHLLEAIIAANHAAIEGRHGVAEAKCDAGCLPLAVLTCIDPRLNALVPAALGLAPEQFVWLRNAGNVITGPTTSTVRSVALSVFVKNAKEIAVIGHTDCLLAKVGMTDLLARLQAQGISRAALTIPNLHEFFGLFSSEKPNVAKAVGFLRDSPIIPPKIPVHGLLIDSTTGRLEWVINGYEAAHAMVAPGISLKGLIDEKLTGNLPGYVSGPLRSLAANIEPLLEQKWDTTANKLAAKIAEAAHHPAPVAPLPPAGPVRPVTKGAPQKPGLRPPPPMVKRPPPR